LADDPATDGDLQGALEMLLAADGGEVGGASSSSLKVIGRAGAIGASPRRWPISSARFWTGMIVTPSTRTASCASTAGTKTVVMPWSRARAATDRRPVDVTLGVIQSRIIQGQMPATSVVEYYLCPLRSTIIVALLYAAVTHQTRKPISP
jgi:hypothetical protein